MSKFLTTFTTPFGTLSIVWRETESQSLVDHIFLSKPQNPSESRAMEVFPQAEKGSSPLIDDLVKALQGYLQGKN
ncbi:MAG: hypothetical protein ACXADB_08330, partial [Candidatus Hermodarchaeia archaeon]